MRRRRSDRGAVAVMVGFLAVALFAVGALAVDLGNAWARKHTVQKQVDVTATSAGHLLPATASNVDAIAAEVAAYLDDADNAAPQSQAAGNGSVLLNGSPADGEVVFYDDGAVCHPVGTTTCREMKVLAPPARVDFGLAGAIGFHSTTVQASATVAVQTGLPPRESVIPYWLPRGCGYGAAHLDTTQGGAGETGDGTGAPATSGGATSPTTAASSTTAADGPTVPLGTHTIGGNAMAATQGASVTLRGLTVGSFSGKVDRASIRFYSPDYSTFVDYAAQDGRQVTAPLNVPDFQVAAEVTGTAGTWHVYALIQPPGSDKKMTLSSNWLAMTVTAPAGTTPTTTTTTTQAAPVPVGCVGQDRGNFGQMDSPRADGSSHGMALNVAVGLDHVVVPFPGASDKNCGAEGKGFLPGAQPDTVSRDGNNCILADAGNDGPDVYSGLIAGVDGHPGRLTTARGRTTCPGRPDLQIGGHAVNNDYLQCFLRNGATLATIAASSGVDSSMLDQSIIHSPRFVWLPVVYANDRAQKSYQPIYDFVPGFVTDETQSSTTPPTGPTNGVAVNGNGNSVQSISVFVFNKDALDVEQGQPTVAYSPALGRATVRLIGVG